MMPALPTVYCPSLVTMGHAHSPQFLLKGGGGAWLEAPKAPWSMQDGLAHGTEIQGKAAGAV